MYTQTNVHTAKYNQEEERFDSILSCSVNCPDSLPKNESNAFLNMSEILRLYLTMRVVHRLRRQI